MTITSLESLPLEKRDFEPGIGRRLPYNVEAEQMLLGAILINSNLLSQVNEFLRREHFFEPLHQIIYQAIIDLNDKDLIISLLTVKAILGQNSSFQDIKGEEYLTKLTTIAMLVINPYQYGRMIFDLAVKRNLIQIGEDIVNNAYSSTIKDAASEQIELAERNLSELATYGLNEKGFLPLGTAVIEALDNIGKAIKNSDHITGISTGIAALDEILLGFQNSDLVIIAGRPGMGKTAFAINFAFNAGQAMVKRTKGNETTPKSVGFFSLEMSSAQIATRMLAMRSKINSTALASGKLSEEQYNNVKKAAIELEEVPFFIDDTPALSIASIATRARKLKRQHNLGILFIDYLQLIKGSIKGNNNRVLEVSEITQGLKAMAKELNIPVIALAQLSRAVESRADNRPILSDLRESGSIEQDADIVMFLYREEYYLHNSRPIESGTEKYNEWQERLDKAYKVAEIMIAKHRNGKIGNVALTYDSELCTIADLKKSGSTAIKPSGPPGRIT